MARRKKKKSKGWFGFGKPPGRKKTKRQIKEAKARTVRNIRIVLVICGLILIFGAAAVGFICLERYVHSSSSLSLDSGGLELVSPPPWVKRQLDSMITDAVGEYYYDIDGSAAETVAGRLQKVVWLYNVKVQETHETIQISASYRKPVAMVRAGTKKYYLSLVKSDDLLYDQDRKKVVVLDYIEISNIPIIEIAEFAPRKVPKVGSVWESEEITTTVELLSLLARMDSISCKENPLLEGLQSIDVSNFDGRRKKDDPHIVLYAKDGTPIHWGAAYGKSTLYLEAKEKEKLGTLYSFYKKHGHSLLFRTNNVCDSVELRLPQKDIPRP